nr:hypothetical protein [Pandoravirus massiliensis]
MRRAADCVCGVSFGRSLPTTRIACCPFFPKKITHIGASHGPRTARKGSQKEATKQASALSQKKALSMVGFSCAAKGLPIKSAPCLCTFQAEKKARQQIVLARQIDFFLMTFFRLFLSTEGPGWVAPLCRHPLSQRRCPFFCFFCAHRKRQGLDQKKAIRFYWCVAKTTTALGDSRMVEIEPPPRTRDNASPRNGRNTTLIRAKKNHADTGPKETRRYVRAEPITREDIFSREKRKRKKGRPRWSATVGPCRPVA